MAENIGDFLQVKLLLSLASRRPRMLIVLGFQNVQDLRKVPFKVVSDSLVDLIWGLELLLGFIAGRLGRRRCLLKVSPVYQK